MNVNLDLNVVINKVNIERITEALFLDAIVDVQTIKSEMSKGPFIYYVITFSLILDPLPPSVIKFGIG